MNWKPATGSDSAWGKPALGWACPAAATGDAGHADAGPVNAKGCGRCLGKLCDPCRGGLRQRRRGGHFLAHGGDVPHHALRVGACQRQGVGRLLFRQNHSLPQKSKNRHAITFTSVADRCIPKIYLGCGVPCPWPGIGADASTISGKNKGVPRPPVICNSIASQCSMSCLSCKTRSSLVPYRALNLLKILFRLSRCRDIGGLQSESTEWHVSSELYVR